MARASQAASCPGARPRRAESPARRTTNEDSAFDRLSTGRKTVLVAGARRVSMGLEAGPQAVGVTVGINLSR